MSSRITSATQPLGRQRTKPARPMSVLVDLEAEAGGQEHAERRQDAHDARLLVGGLEHDHRQPDIVAVLGGDELHEHALLALSAGRRVAADLPVAVGRADGRLALRPAARSTRSPSGTSVAVAGGAAGAGVAVAGLVGVARASPRLVGGRRAARRRSRSRTGRRQADGDRQHRGDDRQDRNERAAPFFGLRRTSLRRPDRAPTSCATDAVRIAVSPVPPSCHQLRPTASSEPRPSPCLGHRPSAANCQGAPRARFAASDAAQARCGENALVVCVGRGLQAGTPGNGLADGAARLPC